MHGMLITLADTASAASGVFSDITSDTFAPLIAEIKEVAKICIPITITLVSIRKGWSWLKSSIRGA